MKQRLCLGRALVHDPPVMVLDEPAAGLDPRARIELREMIRTLAAAGKTILISSHILTELAAVCDLVGILERGRLLAVGTVEEIQRLGQQPHNRVEVRLLDGTAALAEWLAARPGIERLAGQRRAPHLPPCRRRRGRGRPAAGHCRGRLPRRRLRHAAADARRRLHANHPGGGAMSQQTEPILATLVEPVPAVRPASAIGRLLSASVTGSTRSW